MRVGVTLVVGTREKESERVYMYVCVCERV